jgi:hypothetical protein
VTARRTRLSRRAIGLTATTLLCLTGLTGLDGAAGAEPLSVAAGADCFDPSATAAAGSAAHRMPDAADVDPNTLGQSQVEEIERAADARLGELGLTRDEAAAAKKPIKIRVFFHVINAGKSEAKGNLADKTIKQTVRAMDRAFHGKQTGDAARLPFTFVLEAIDRTTNADWYYDLRWNSAEERAMKIALHKGRAKALNIYTALPAAGISGWATFPWDFEAHPRMDGLVLSKDMVYGGDRDGWQEGDVFSHETGHWLGLYHTFQGGCSGGDEVADTAPEASYAEGCPAGRDTCAGDGLDPIHNFMDYTDNPCTDRFTPGQRARAAAMWTAYRGS